MHVNLFHFISNAIVRSCEQKMFNYKIHTYFYVQLMVEPDGSADYTK